ncbi:hypothetical protein [Chitinophaga sp. HK235]|uniref:hypothetical protein n=1 Tax=Chitinophaga sp. HK235 TaxID=2952571 RepID=UPI001BABDD6C|nr:hypothetical protein [Chitinophaga sp. HK235]
MEAPKEDIITIVKGYFEERHKIWRVGDLEQRLIANGYQPQVASREALMAFGNFFKEKKRKDGVRVLVYLGLAAVFLIRILLMSNKIGNVPEVSGFLALTAFALVMGLIGLLKLFQLREEIVSFRDLRKL